MKYNVVVVCVDTFRADMGGAGSKLDFVQTPHLDRLRREGVDFTRCFGEGEPTIPVRRCLFTGRRSFPWRFAVPNEGLQPAGWGWHAIPPDQDTLAERLCDAGWLTGLVADTYHMFKPTMNFTRGFLSWDFVRGQEGDLWQQGPPSSVDLPAHVPEGDDASPANHAVMFQYLLNMRGRRAEEDWTAAQVFRKASQFLVDNRRNGPFFLWVDSFSPHEFWDPPRAYADAYCPPQEGIKDYIHHSVLRGDFGRMSAAEIERTRALYFGFVTFVDRWLGHLLEQMDAMRLWDDTVFIFLTDHGTELMDKGRFGKSADRLHPYNTQLNWIIRHPQGPRGERCDAWTQNHDFAPTLLALLGLDGEGLDGCDVWPHGREVAVRDHVITGWGGNVCVRDEKWAMHMNVTSEDFAKTARVFDLEDDADEEDDVAATHPQVVQGAVERVEELTGALPVKFTEYRQRRPARTMREFARIRYGQGD